MDGGVLPPFLLKTYEMVDDALTDDIVSWSFTNASFVVWNPADFAARILPTYFKHNNFASFIRQLNTYVRILNPCSVFRNPVLFLGFKKIDPERWEFANNDFRKGKKHLLTNIHRRKPSYSHIHPLGPNAERAALEEEIERLNREKTDLRVKLRRFEQQQSGTQIHMDDLERRLNDMERRQLKVAAFLQQAMQKPQLMESLLKMAGSSSRDFSVIHKRRRLPPFVDYNQAASTNSFGGAPYTSNKPDIGYILDQDFGKKLTLEFSTTILDDALLVAGTPNNESRADFQAKQTDLGHELIECLSLVPETSKLCDTEAPICATENGLLGEIDEGDELFPFHLDLMLEPNVMQKDYKTPDLVDQAEANIIDLETSNTAIDNDLNIPVGTNKNMTPDPSTENAVSSKVVLPTNDEALTVTMGANDPFWQQFLTERPGS
ncbi:hypothetical protein Cni_G10113 [Canna indica]|uniref:HSF-type DNA-binding domain-containing protein n=1 Tax=Canna indica TaxID=4628 RepID=A0AAQ3K767_9LILI|nr:hypothetical protein Cni_G10113 [Canna indica]